MMNQRIILGVLLSILFLGIGALVFLSKVPRQVSAPTTLQVPPDMGGSFTLTNQDGMRSSVSDFNGRYKLIYFGFTHCPAICPTELQKMSKALFALNDEQVAQLQPIFVSVDPDRDTVPVLKDYVSLFSMNLVAFTGTQTEIDAVKKQFRVYSAKVIDPNSSEYSVDHSSYIYLLDPDNKVVALYKTDDTAEIITQSLLGFIE